MIIQVSKQKQTMGQSGKNFGFYGFAKSDLYEMAFKLFNNKQNLKSTINVVCLRFYFCNLGVALTNH